MRNRITFLIKILMALTLGMPVSLYAQEEETTDTVETVAEEEVPSEVYTSAPLNFTVTTSELKCGSPVTFTIHATGGSGNYLYYWNSIYTLIDGSYTQELDLSVSSNQYQSSNTFTYTFMASGTYRMRFYVSDPGDNWNYKRADFTYTISDPAYPPVEAVADAIVAQCQNMATDYEKVLFCHDWIINNAVYDQSYLYMGEMGVLCHGKGTCESYHRALALLLKRLDIPIERAEGNGHLWSCVYMDGQWTQIDATWDGGSAPAGMEYLRHLYFGLTDDLMKTAHSDHMPDSVHPCDSLVNNWFIKSGEIKAWSDPIQQEIEARRAKGETDFTIEAPYHMYPTIFTILYPINGWYLNEKVYGPDVTVTYAYDLTVGGLPANARYHVTIEKTKSVNVPVETWI